MNLKRYQNKYNRVPNPKTISTIQQVLSFVRPQDFTHLGHGVNTKKTSVLVVYIECLDAFCKLTNGGHLNKLRSVYRLPKEKRQQNYMHPLFCLMDTYIIQCKMVQHRKMKKNIFWKKNSENASIMLKWYSFSTEQKHQCKQAQNISSKWEFSNLQLCVL